MLKKVIIDLRYFNDGDYTNWYDDDVKQGYEGTYSEWLEEILKPKMNEYDRLELYSDGTLYGYKDGISHDISYNEFDDPEVFDEIVETYGYKVEEVE